MFNFTALLGAQSTSPASQSLLELDGGIKILVDVGWDDSFDVAKLRELEKQIPTLSLILLTHASPAHIGAFAHCCKNFPLFTRIPIYATTPVISLGRTLLQDLYASTPLASTVIPTSSLQESSYSYSTSTPDNQNSNILLQPPTLEEIAGYFSLIHPLKYSQPHQPLPSPFSPPLNGLTVTAYDAGHTLGGTIWHIQHGLESIVYAVDWNQARENVLSGAAWLGGAGASGAEVIEQLRKPTALVCSSRGAERVALPGGRKKRDELLLDQIRATVAKGGIVLIPTDSSARVLELAYLLENAWQDELSAAQDDSPAKTAKAYLLSKTIGATMRYARSMLEWMDESIVRELETDTAAKGRTDGSSSKTSAPFDFKHLKLLEKKRQVDKMLATDGPKVILASDTSLEWGFSRDVLRKISNDSNNLVVLTDRLISNDGNEKHGALGYGLWKCWEERVDGVAPEVGSNGDNLEQVYGGGQTLEITEAQTSPLEGQELVVYQQYLATQRQLQDTMHTNSQALFETAGDAIEDNVSESSSSSEESDPEQQGKALNMSAALASATRNRLGLSNEDLGINVLLRRKGVYDYDVRGKRGREKMFPFVAKRKRTDDFGELIRPEEYLRAEERDEVDGHDIRASGNSKETRLGEKRKWEDIGMSDLAGRRSSVAANKRKRAGDEQVEQGERNDTSGTNGVADEDESEEEYEPWENDSEDQPGFGGPSKIVFSKEKIQLNLRIAYVDFAGLHDKRSLQMLIPLINPRKLILVGGTAEETNALAVDCRKLLGDKGSGSTGSETVDIFTPINGLFVDASVDTNAWSLKLSSSLSKHLHWQTVRGLGIVTLTGCLTAVTEEEDNPETQETKTKKQKTSKEDATCVDISESTQKEGHCCPVLDEVPASMASTTHAISQPLHVGDLRLADLRKILQASGHTAEFRGEGTMVVDSMVAVRKSGTGKIEIEGAAMTLPGYNINRNEGSFYAVKRKIYEGLAVVSGR